MDILVNNAGVMYYTSMISLLEDEWERTVDVNCKVVLHILLLHKILMPLILFVCYLAKEEISLSLVELSECWAHSFDFTEPFSNRFSDSFFWR